jgi:phosphatidylglycerol:prolipoprotein diacylglycerol transferase
MDMISIDWNPMPYLGPVPINWCGMTFAIAIFTARSLVIRWAPKYGFSKDSIDRLLVWILVGVVAGARLYYIVQNDLLSYLAQPWRILAIWEGGLAFFGGLIGGIGAAYLCCRRDGFEFTRAADLFAPSIPIAGAIGRISCGLDAWTMARRRSCLGEWFI